MIDKQRKKLKNYRNNLSRLEMLNIDIDNIYDNVVSNTANELSVKCNTNICTDSTYTTTMRVIDLKDLLCKQRVMLLQDLSSIITAIEALDEPYKSLLYMRYVQCQKWEDIASNLALSVSRCYTIHNDALLLIDIKSDNMYE